MHDICLWNSKLCLAWESKNLCPSLVFTIPWLPLEFHNFKYEAASVCYRVCYR